MEDLIVGFDFTDWANRRWHDALPGFPEPSRAEEVMRHMSDWQRIWLDRASRHVRGVGAERLEGLAVIEALEKGTEEWRALLRVHSDQDVRFVTMEGQEMSMALHTIAKQLIYHGIYHRGHLRGLAEAAGYDDFPDTDWYLYCTQR